MSHDIYNDPNPPKWPNNGIPFNRWYTRLGLFLLRLRDFKWYDVGEKQRFKYVSLRIDTRNGNFLVFDQDGAPASPDDIFDYEGSAMIGTRETIIEIRNRTRKLHVERVERVTVVSNKNIPEMVYDGFVDGRKTQEAKSAEDIMRWLGNALEDGT